MTIRVLLVGDHRMLRDALRALLAAERDIEVVGEAGTGREAIALAQRRAPEVLVLENVPDATGFDVARRLRLEGSPVRIVALCERGDNRCVQEMLRAGVAGYVTKTASGKELVRAIRAAARGDGYFSPDVARTVMDHYATGAPGFVLGAREREVLGTREREVLALIAEGQHSRAIAGRLGIAVATVEVHRRNLMRKLDLHSVATLTKYAIRKGLTAP
jgi:two-component system NarL family response regulator